MLVAGAYAGIAHAGKVPGLLSARGTLTALDAPELEPAASGWEPIGLGRSRTSPRSGSAPWTSTARRWCSTRLSGRRRVARPARDGASGSPPSSRALGIAALGSVLNGTYASNVDVSGLSGEAAGAAGSSIAAAQQVAGELGARGSELALSAQSAFVDGFHASLWLGAVVLGLAAVVTLVLGPRAGQVALDTDEDKPARQDTAARQHVPTEQPLVAPAR